MSTDPKTYFTDTADPGQTDFSFNFDYLEDEHVTVTIDDVATTDFTIVTSPAKKIVLDTPATGGEIVRVQRISAPDENLVDFQNGSVLTESELDRAYLHNRYLAEESAEQNDVSLRVKTGASGSFDALNKKIVNVSDPTADQDAATKNYVDDTVAGVVAGTIPNNAVTYAKLQNATGNNILLGNDNGADSDIQELTATEVRTILNVADGANNYSHPNHTGDVTSTGDGATVIADNAVTSGKISDSDGVFKVSLGNVVINENAGLVNFRAEGNSNANLITTDASLNAVGIGTTPVAGIALKVGGSQIIDSGNLVAEGSGARIIRSISSDSTSALELYANGQATDQKRFILSMGDAAGEFTLAAQNDNGTAGYVWNFNITDGSFNPDADNSQNCGSSGNRWATIFAGTGTINTSDRNEKDNIEELTEAERRVAVAIKGLVKKFRFKGGVRTHVGVIAQDVQAAFNAEGLNAADYGMFCSDTFQDKNGVTVTRLGIRYEELLAFVISAL